jgi:hypothetical protein
MGGEGDSAWRTLVLFYSVVLVAALCLPPITVVPLLFGVDSLLILLCAGTAGLAVTGGVSGLLVARYDARGDRRQPDTSTPVDPRSGVGDREPPTDAESP